MQNPIKSDESQQTQVQAQHSERASQSTGFSTCAPFVVVVVRQSFILLRVLLCDSFCCTGKVKKIYKEFALLLLKLVLSHLSALIKSTRVHTKSVAQTPSSSSSSSPTTTTSSSNHLDQAAQVTSAQKNKSLERVEFVCALCLMVQQVFVGQVREKKREKIFLLEKKWLIFFHIELNKKNKEREKK